MLQINQKPIIAARGELLRNDGAGAVDEDAELGLAGLKISFELLSGLLVAHCR